MAVTVDISGSPLLRSLFDRAYEEGARQGAIRSFDWWMSKMSLEPTDEQRRVILALGSDELTDVVVSLAVDPVGTRRSVADRLEQLEAIVSRVGAGEESAAPISAGARAAAADPRVVGRRNSEVVEEGLASGTPEGMRRALSTLADAWVLDIYADDRIRLASQPTNASLEAVRRLAACSVRADAQNVVDDILEGLTGRVPLGRSRRRRVAASDARDGS